MDSIFLMLIIILAIVMVISYFTGRKRNSWIAGWIAKETEEVLKPKDSNYVNIGGTIGYNSQYKLSKPFKDAKGTFTLLPRQSILYMPISLLVSKHDNYYLNIFTKIKLVGEGHILSDDYFGRRRTTIYGIDRMERKIIETENGKKFIMLWSNHRLESILEEFFNKVEEKDLLKHFCCYAENKTFFVHMNPKQNSVKKLLASVVKNVNVFFDDKNPLTKEDSNPNSIPNDDPNTEEDK